MSTLTGSFLFSAKTYHGDTLVITFSLWYWIQAKSEHTARVGAYIFPTPKFPQLRFYVSGLIYLVERYPPNIVPIGHRNHLEEYPSFLICKCLIRALGILQVNSILANIIPIISIIKLQPKKVSNFMVKRDYFLRGITMWLLINVFKNMNGTW